MLTDENAAAGVGCLMVPAARATQERDGLESKRIVLRSPWAGYYFHLNRIALLAASTLVISRLTTDRIAAWRMLASGVKNEITSLSLLSLCTVMLPVRSGEL